jgi:hypothetical protein
MIKFKYSQDLLISTRGLLEKTLFNGSGVGHELSDGVSFVRFGQRVLSSMRSRTIDVSNFFNRQRGVGLER